MGAHREAEEYCEIWGVGGTVLLDESGDYASLLGVRGVPTNIFVDADGTVTSVGAVTPDELEVETRRLLGPDADIDAPT